MIDTSDSTGLGKASYAAGTDTISIDSAIAIPPEAKISMTPEHVDVGRQHFVALSSIDCAALADAGNGDGGTATTGPSARTYTFATGDWACDDLPATDEQGGTVWALDGTARRRLEGDKYDILGSRQDPAFEL